MSQTGNVFSTPVLSVLDKSEQHAFVQPTKMINEGSDVAAFLVSQAYCDLMTFLLQLNRAMFPCRIQSIPDQMVVKTWELDSPDVPLTNPALRLKSLLEELHTIVDEIPPKGGPRRFGDLSFREWYKVVEERSSALLKRHLPEDLKPEAIVEVQSYFLGSFGSAQRLDYGSGHELSFLAFLGCMWKLGGFGMSSTGEQERCIIIGIIQPYLQLIRRLIMTYNLEPAGSHGVWGLDDHSFMPYIFGSAQYGPPISPTDQTPTEGSLENAPNPADVAKLAAVNREREKNMYFGAIGFIHDVKKGPFWEHSPMLYDISGVRAGWAKINKGMIKMYNAEVLSKFPVVQHFRFGTLFSWDRDPNAVAHPTSIHTSNQPAKEGTGSASTNKTTARGSPLEATRVPWAKGTGSLPAPGAGTAAPWATTRLAASGTGLPPTQFPKPDSRNLPLDDGNAQSMPPPTRAPWAK